MEYKVGDKLKCIKKDTCFFKFGEIYQIKEKNDDGEGYYELTSNNKDSYILPEFLKESFEKVEDDIIGIYKPKYNGVKPMEWELVWERKEPKYYLRSWIDGDGYVVDNVLGNEENYLNFFARDNLLFIADYEDFELSKTQFTQKEIEELPNQEFIKTLVKELVE